jgi:hypothetical protein
MKLLQALFQGKFTFLYIYRAFGTVGSITGSISGGFSL